MTRLGYGSKAVITGDATQIDLASGKPSGLKEASRILKGVHGIRFVTFTEKDVARHHLVQEIIAAYERDDNQSNARRYSGKSLNEQYRVQRSARTQLNKVLLNRFQSDL